MVKLLRPAILVLLPVLLRRTLPRLLALLRQLFESLTSREDRARGESVAQGLSIPSEAYRRPDPCLYSQAYLLARGMAVTWDNPDIWLERDGVRVAANEVLPDTTYDIVAQIWNGSNGAPAVGLAVQFGYRSFGIGGAPSAIGSTFVNLPVRGAAGHPTYARQPWRTPAGGGHYCLLVGLDWPDDANPYNNLGQANLLVRAAATGTTLGFLIPVVSTSAEGMSLDVRLDGYGLPPRANMMPAPAGRGRSSGAPEPSAPTAEEVARQEEAVVRGNAWTAFPAPAVWQAALASTELDLPAGEEGVVELALTVPGDAVSGTRQPFNVVAMSPQGLVIGGVTILVEVI